MHDDCIEKSKHNIINDLYKMAQDSFFTVKNCLDKLISNKHGQN